MSKPNVSRHRQSGPMARTRLPSTAVKATRKFEIVNVNHPGHVTRVDAAMYGAMKRAFLRVLPKSSPGLTEADIRERVMAHLPRALFPNGARAGWWSKSVQLDLEAKGIVAREKVRPLRWHKTR